MLVALFVTLIPTTIGGLLSAIGIAGMDRLVRFNVIATSGRAVEAAGDVDTLLLDKTGTITFGNRMADAFIARAGRRRWRDLAEAGLLASLADETPEGRSIVALAQADFGWREPDVPGGATPCALHRADPAFRAGPAGRPHPQGRGRCRPALTRAATRPRAWRVPPGGGPIARSGGTPLAGGGRPSCSA